MAISSRFQLVPWLTIACAACADSTERQDSPGADGEGSQSDGAAGDVPPSESWGRLASAGHEGDPVVATLFFAGEARDGSMRYEYPTSSNMELYTERPSDPELLHWSSDPVTRFAALDQMVETGVNVIYLSNWGPRGSAAWSMWAPMQTSTYAHDEVLSAIGTRPLLIVPYLESTPEWRFRSDFPGTAQNPAPGLVQRIVELVDRIIVSPQDPAWPSRWAEIMGPDGEPRRAIALIHASSAAAINDQQYADGLDAVADAVEAATGVRVGFLLDAMPPASLAPGRFFPDPTRTALPMSRSSSVLGISCFLPEIWIELLDESDDVARMAWKREFIGAWADSGVPTLIDVAPGYDAALVFPGSVRYGHTAEWRDGLKSMVADFGEDGLVLNSWNGYTEAMVIVPTAERGDAAYRWAVDLSASVGSP